MSHLTDLFKGHGLRAEYNPVTIEVLEPDSGLDQLAMIESTLGIVPPAIVPLPEEPPVQAKIVKVSGHYKNDDLVVIAEPEVSDE
jgi:hypothetical protein